MERARLNERAVLKEVLAKVTNPNQLSLDEKQSPIASAENGVKPYRFSEILLFFLCDLLKESF